MTIPDYPEEPADDEQRETRARYDRVKGSAVNPVLRQGNSDRRAPGVGQGVRAQAPALDGRVVARTRARTSSTMSDGDFRSTEQSVTVGRGRDGADRARSDDDGRSPC